MLSVLRKGIWKQIILKLQRLWNTKFHHYKSIYKSIYNDLNDSHSCRDKAIVNGQFDFLTARYKQIPFTLIWTIRNVAYVLASFKQRLSFLNMFGLHASHCPPRFLAGEKKNKTQNLKPPYLSNKNADHKNILCPWCYTYSTVWCFGYILISKIQIAESLFTCTENDRRIK